MTMKTLKSIIIIGILFIFNWNYSQQMDEGFNLLETGAYAEAEDYFKQILEQYPNQRTATLCYGRAVGLNGNPEKALTLFTELLEVYPNDFEIKLNYGEALLWNRKFSKAQSYYKALVIEDSKSFPALLGYANTLSNLKNYPQALEMVNKALIVSPGNLNALTSKKYIYLGYAYQNQQAQNLEHAETLLLEALELLNNDKDILLNLANLYIIKEDFNKAEATYNQLDQNTSFNTEAKIGLALVAHLNGKDKQALDLSKRALDSSTTDNNKNASERYIQALIWNRKFKDAQSQIDQLMTSFSNENWVLALRATLHIYKSDFDKSLEDYNKILANDSTSFDGNLGKANTLKALGNYEDAYLAAAQTLQFYNKQKDAVQFISKLDESFSPSLHTKAAYSFDNGNNIAYYANSSITIPVSTKLSFTGQYNYRSTSNSETDDMASSNDFSIGTSYRIKNNITLKGNVGVTSASAENNNFTQLLTDLSVNIKPFKLQTLDIGYKRDLQSFNADLLDREIVQNNYYLNYNLATNINLGWYTQLIYTSQNDGNTRQLLFTSLYYNLLRNPSLKVGLNYQFIGFKNQVPEIYFSPKQFNAGEVFINIIKDENIVKPKSWFYELTAATGIQNIKDNDSQTTYRFQGKLGYKFSKRALLNIYGTHSNIASATAAGFTFTEIGLRFKWNLFNQPIFRN